VQVSLVTGAGAAPFASEEGPLIHEGDIVRFRLEDIFMPPVDELPVSLTTAGRLEGTVITFSDSGPLARVFAVIDVTVHQSVIVPIEKLQLHNVNGASKPL
jgi:hypothetical protein